MKTTLLILSLLFTGLDLWAQNTPPAMDNAAASTNRDQILRRALRQAIIRGTNVTTETATPAVAVPPVNTAVSPTTPAASGIPSVPEVAAPTTPTIPAPVPTAVVTTPTPTRTVARAADSPDMDQMIPPGMTTFVNTDLNQVLDIYARLIKRTLLRPANLSSPPITFKAQTELTKRETIQALDTILGMSGIAVINVGDKFAKVVPTTGANTEAAPWSQMDPADLPETGQYMTHVMQLTYVKPSELVQVLQPFQKMPNAAIGIDSSQIIILRDYTENVKRMLEMIKLVDVSVPAEIVSEVIPIKYALAGDIASALNSVSSGTTTTTVGTGAGGAGATFPGGGGGRTGVGGAGGLNGARTTTTYGGVGTQAGTARFGGAANANPNLGGGGGFNAGGGQGGNLTDRVRAIINRAAGGAAGEFQILGQTKVIADERTNSLLVFATRPDMDMIKNIISKLDVVLAQVLIEAIIVDVALNKERNIGVSAAQEPTKMGPLAGGGGFNNAGFLRLAPGTTTTGSGTNLVTTLVNLSTLSTNLLSSLGSGFSYFGTFDQGWDIAVTALETDNRVNILSRPRIQTSHAVPATLFIGQTIPYINGTTTDINGGNRSTYEQRDVGINLSVLPLINPEGLVVMDIQEDIEQLGRDVIIDNNPIPQTIRRSASAKVAVRDGDTIILGGFISTTKSKSKSGVPFLSSVPLLGYLFRQTIDHTERNELAVLLHPKVLKTPEIAAIASDDDQTQMPGVMRAKREIQKAERKAVEDEQRRESKENREKDKTPF